MTSRRLTVLVGLFLLVAAAGEPAFRAVVSEGAGFPLGDVDLTGVERVLGAPVRHGVGYQLVGHERRVVAQLVGRRLVGEELQHELARDRSRTRVVLEVLADRARPCRLAHQAPVPPKTHRL